jgi:hypothetical protein
MPPISIVNYNLAGLTIQVGADLPLTKKTFAPQFDAFQVQDAGRDIISLRHHFKLPEISDLNLKKEVFRKPPWAIYLNDDNWVYIGIALRDDDPWVYRIALFNYEYTNGQIYNLNENFFLQGNLHSLTLF